MIWLARLKAWLGRRDFWRDRCLQEMDEHGLTRRELARVVNERNELHRRVRSFETKLGNTLGRANARTL